MRLQTNPGHLVRIIACGILACAALGALFPDTARAAGPGAVMTPAGYDANAVARGDDTFASVVNLPFSFNWNGTTYTQVYVNMNGNVTFGSSYTGYNPSATLAATGRNIIAPLWADVDTRNAASSQMTYSSTVSGSVPQVDGHSAFFVNWVNVARYNNQSAPLNSFQLVLVDRSDTGAGNFDIIFNYDQVTWDLATASSTYRARAGWGFAGTGFELPGSGVASGGTSALLDSSSPATSLVQNSLNSGGQLGRYVFQVRNGQAPNAPPAITAVNVTLEGNAAEGYLNYTGAGDVLATDGDGSIASLTSDMPVALPLGTTVVTWTATDNRGATATATQTIFVQDTTAPANPTALECTSHAPGLWSADNSPDVLWAGDASDICSGIDGYSFDWSPGSASTPDTVADPATATTTSSTDPSVVDEQTFATSVWPAAWTRSDATYVRLTNAAGRALSSYGVEVWANNTNRRTANFYQDYDLAGLTTATLSYWEGVSALSSGADYLRVEYSSDGGTSWTALDNLTGVTSAATYTRSYSLPVGGTVRVRFSASVNRTTEYVDWDDIRVTGTTTTAVTTYSPEAPAVLADGVWYLNLRTIDNADNASAAIHIGPYLIDTAAPVTVDNLPVDWTRGPVEVTLSATDAGQISSTTYTLDGSTWLTYGGPFVISAEGATDMQYYSADAAGHIEAIRSATVRIDNTPPPAPEWTLASPDSTSTVEVEWAACIDTSGSGLAGYRIYRDGVLIATTPALSFTDSGLTPGQEYAYQIAAFDEVRNESALVSPVRVELPVGELWLTVSDTAVDMGAVDPGSPRTVLTATTVTVGGVGALSYDLTCEATDFVNTDSGAPTPIMPANLLDFRTGGWTSRIATAFRNEPYLVDSGIGTAHVWTHDYIFDYVLTVPYTYSPGTYVSHVTYTVVRR